MGHALGYRAGSKRGWLNIDNLSRAREYPQAMDLRNSGIGPPIERYGNILPVHYPDIAGEEIIPIW